MGEPLRGRELDWPWDSSTENLRPITRMANTMKYTGEMTLDELAHRETDYKLWTDKRSGDGMGYLPIYEEYFRIWRNDTIHLLEVGVNMGASVLLWLDYFPNAHIYGVDIEPRTRPEHERYTFIQGDQLSKPFWQSF